MAITPTNPPPTAPPPNVVQNASMATTPEGGITPQGQNFDSLKSSWLDFFKRPEVISGALQFGSSMLAGSNVGAGLAEAAQAASGTRETIQARGQQGLEESNRQRLAAVQERGVAAEEARTTESARSNKVQEGQTAEGMRQKADEFTKTMALEFGKLGVEKQRADTYANYMGQLAGNTAKKIPGYTDAVKAAMQNLSLQYDPGTPEWEAALQSSMSAINSAFHVTPEAGEATPTLTPAPAPTTVAPSAPGGGTEIPTVLTPQDYAGVKEGGQYKDPQGNVRVKPIGTPPPTTGTKFGPRP